MNAGKKYMTQQDPLNPSGSQASRWAILAGMLTIYVVWSSTYLAIRFAVETMPPFLMAGVRFLVAGLFLYALRRLKGDPAPSSVEWRSTGLIGIFLLVGGNGGVVWAEQRIVSSIAALVVGATPLWIILIDMIRLKGKLPPPLSIIGVVIGFVGITILVGPWQSKEASLTSLDPLGVVSLLIASISWALGSVYSRQVKLPPSPLLATGMEMTIGGSVLLILGTLLGESRRLNLADISARSWWALIYLVIIGALLGFAAYTWLLRVAPLSLVSTYAYVNPLMALILGNLLAQEPITPRLLVSAIIIIGSVALITTSNIVSARRRRIIS